jgi:hypothetical protein
LRRGSGGISIKYPGKPISRLADVAMEKVYFTAKLRKMILFFLNDWFNGAYYTPKGEKSKGTCEK